MFKIPITKPFFDKKEEIALKDTLKSLWVTQGPKVSEFEADFAQYVKSKYAIATTSCTTALHLALLLSGIKAGDEVLVPSFTFIATANVIVHIGAKPIFCDIDLDTYNIDPEEIEKKVTKKTKAILFVDQLGLPADIDKILKIAKKHNLAVIEDAACALGSKYKNKPIGSISPITCFSFHPRKIITTGEGGLLTANNKAHESLARILINHGMSLSDFERHKNKKIIFEKYSKAGYNYRLTDIQAAIGLEQLKKLPKILEKRKYLAERYNKLLSEIKYIKTPFIPIFADHNYQSYIIRLTEDSPIKQKTFMQKLLDAGIATRRGVMACHLEPYYQKIFNKIHLPKTELATRSTILLPIFHSMVKKEQNFVIEQIKHIFK